MYDTNILSGKKVSEYLKESLSSEIDYLKKQGVLPGLAAIIVGENQSSKLYVKSKSKYFDKMGCYSETFCLGQESSEKDITNLIEQLNAEWEIKDREVTTIEAIQAQEYLLKLPQRYLKLADRRKNKEFSFDISRFDWIK